MEYEHVRTERDSKQVQYINTDVTADRTYRLGHTFTYTLDVVYW